MPDDEHRTAGVRHDLHGHGADAGPAEDTVPHRSDDDERGGASGVNERLARVTVADRRRHGQRGVDGVRPRDPIGDEAPGVRRGDVRPVRELAEPEHR